MSENKVVVSLSINDLISPEIAKIKANIASIGGIAKVGSLDPKVLGGLTAAEMDKLKANMMGLKSATEETDITFQTMVGSFLGNMGAKAMVYGIQKVTQAFGQMKGAIQEASQIEIQGLAQAGDLSARLGVSHGAAVEISRRLRMDVATMAAELPGSNANYKSISDQISASVAKLTPGDQEAFLSNTRQLTQSYGVLAAVRGADANMGGAALNQALAGTRGMGELRQIDLFQRNPELMQYLGEELKKIGSSESNWRQLTDQQRFDVLLNAGKKSISEATLASFEGTMNSMIETVNTKLWDKDVGLFGVMRKIDAVGDRSVLDAATESGKAFLGFVGALGESAKAAGLEGIDPMAEVVGGFDWLTNILNGMAGLFRGGDTESIMQNMSNFSGVIFEWLGHLIDGLLGFLLNFNFASFGENVGFFIGELFTMLLTRVEWGKLLAIVMISMVRLMESLVWLAWGAIKGIFTELIKGMRRLGGLIRDNFMGAINQVGGAIVAPVRGAGNFLGSAWDRLTGRNQPERTNVLPSNQRETPAQPVASLPTIRNNREAQTVAFAPSITISGVVQDAQEMAQVVMDKIDQQWQQYQQNVIA